MNRKAFHKLLQRYVEGKCTSEEKQLIDQWYELLDLENELDMPDVEMNEIENRLWNKIKNKSVLKSSLLSTKVYRLNGIKRWLVAASVLIIAGFFYLFFKNFTSNKNSIGGLKIPAELVQYTNSSDTAEDITLEDKSIIRLQPHSKIGIPKHFDQNKREVYLNGEAFFKVSKNPSRPFLVYNNNIVTEVLGTSFTVKEINNKIEVSVRTGRVAVYENSEQLQMNNEQKKANGVIITPNQKVTYYVDERHFVTSVVDDPVPIPVDKTESKKISFVFDDAPLSQVISALEKEYGLEIIVNDESLNNKPFTGDITQQNLYNKLDLICQALQVSYEIKGTRILIKNH